MTPRISWMAMVTVLGPTLLLPARVAMAAQPTAAKPTPATVVIHGRGNGHGVGLPQDGALSLGRSGRTAAQILSTFYPGTTLQSDRSARMHVEVWQDAAASGSAQIRLPSGGKIYGAQGHVAVPAGGLVDLTFTGDQWAARLATIPLGSGGRSIPRSLTDDPSPDPASDSPTPTGTPASADPSADPSAADPSPSPPAAEPTATSSSEDPTQPPAPSGAPTGSDAAQPSGSVSAVTDTRTLTPSPHHAASPSAVPTTGTLAATVQTSVSGPRLAIVPVATDGLTTVVSTGRSYRGQVLTAPGELVNDVPLELYLQGLGEVLDPSWPQSGLQALVIAARTYALRDALGADDPGDHQHVNICATDACQVYLGAGVEYPQLTQAVEATRGKVLEWQGELAETYYSASAGGETATPSEGFGDGSTDVPYLTPVSYDDGGHDGWQRSIDLGAAATALHYPGQLSEFEVTARGPSGRATAVVLHGSGGDVATTGVAVEAALGLPSTLFTTGFGVDAPQVAAATSGSVLPALTAASLGQVAVPVPVLAPDTVPASPDLTGQPAVVSAGSDHSELRPGWDDQADASASERLPVGVIVWFALLGWLVVTACVVLATRALASLLRRPGGHRHRATTIAATTG